MIVVIAFPANTLAANQALPCPLFAFCKHVCLQIFRFDYLCSTTVETFYFPFQAQITVLVYEMPWNPRCTAKIVAWDRKIVAVTGLSHHLLCDHTFV